MLAVVVAKEAIPLAVKPVVEAFPRVVCPVTFNVPLAVRDEVAVIDPPVIVPPVNVVKKALMPLSKVAKRLDDVAFVLVRLVIEPLVLVRLVAVRPVDEAFPKVVWPLTVRAVADAFPKLDVPEINVENVPVVKDGLEDTAMVLVPEKMTFAPAMRFEIGLL